MNAEGEGSRTVSNPGAPKAASRYPTTPPAPSAAGFAPASTTSTERRLQAGDVLNHMFEVRRYISAGGMGEVWEGVNTQTQERVAIKVILPRLASDPKIQAMFRKEASTLTRLLHPALVAYRALAMEPVLGILYIVTEYIEGENLDGKLREVPRDEASLRRLIRRLAEGLRAAHELGAVHRDMSPDNVLLEGGRLEGARIIDFGIAKDLDPRKATVVGDGFAGKLSYVAPEQLGDYGRNVGPWTDVYSLALVILAVAAGSSPKTGGTMVDAVDRRRGGIDVSAAPVGLWPLLTAMLAPDPAQRLPDMGAVLAALDRMPPAAPTPVLRARQTRVSPAGSGRRFALIGGGVAAALIAAAGIGWGLNSGIPSWIPGSGRIAGVAADPVANATASITRVLPTVPCAWLEVRDLRADGDAVSFSLGGAAGDPLAAQAALQRALGAIAIRTMTTDIAPMPSNLCPVMDTFSQVRETGPALLSLPHSRWELDKNPAKPNEKVARVPLTIDGGVSGQDFAFVFWDPVSNFDLQGERERVLRLAFVLGPDGRYVLKDGGGFSAAGLKAIALVRGRGPFDANLVKPAFAPTQGWRDRFLRTARARGWTVEMVWFQTQDLTPQ